MLADWYFCCCIKASPSTTNALLSILETLENPESDGKLLYLAYDELRRTNLWMQVYALPQVLESLHHPNQPGSLQDTIIRHYFDDLIENLPEKEVGKKFKYLINIVLGDAKPFDIIKALTGCARITQQDNRSEIPSRTPYLDLKAFLPETLMLAVIANQCEHNSDFVAELSSELESELEEEISPLNSLIEDSIKYYEYGRLAFRIGVSISHLTKFYLPEQLLSLIRETPNSVVELEPDLLHTYASILFEDKPISSLIQESLTLRELRQLKPVSLQRRNDDSRDDESDELLRRIGLTPNEYLQRDLSIVYWQSTLWELASWIDAPATAKELSDLWQPASEKPEQINIECRNLNEAKEWREQLISLLNIRRKSVTITPLKTKQDLFLPNASKWLFGSPWISFNYRGRQREYPVAEKPENLVRLIVSLSVSIRLLQDKKNLHRVEFIKLIAHASDVFDKTYKKSLKNKDERQQNIKQFPLPLIGMALFAKRQVSLVGSGHIESISPENFLEILRSNPNSDDSQNTPLSDEKEFLESVLPEVLMSWIFDAYRSAVEPNRSVSWLTLIPEVYHYYKQGKHENSIRQEAALVMRFLTNQFSDYDDFDWQKNTNGNSWKVNHKALLLSKPNLPPKEWHKPDWDEAELSASSRLVRALERLVSLSNLSDEPSIPQEMEKWHEEWQDCLYQLSKTEQLYRFTRLRLVELLAHPILNELEEEQKLIAYVLLEYGCTYDLKKMIEYVYFTDADAVTEARKSLQDTLLQAIQKFLEQNALSLVEERNQRIAQDPRHTRINFQKAELFQATFSQIIQLGLPFQKRRLRKTLKAIRRNSLNQRCATTTTRVEHCSIEQFGFQKRIIPSPSRVQGIADWSLKAAVYDPNRLTATLFYDDFDLTGLVNLFELSKDKIEEILHGRQESLNVLAIVVQVETLENNKFKYTFNCGFDDYICGEITEKGGQNFQQYEHIALYIRRDGDRRWIVPDEQRSIRHLQRRLLPNKDIDKIKVVENWDSSLQQRTLRLERGSEEITNKVDLRLWDADVSRRFRNLQNPERNEVFAQFTSKSKWMPYDHDFIDLILKAFNEADSIAVLTFIDEDKGQFGEKIWRFSIQPGENYLLNRDHFVEEDAKALEKELINLGGACHAWGLLIPVKLVIEDDRVRLMLLKEEISDIRANDSYPNLERRFDYRNIHWQELFSQSNEGYIAEKEGENWYYDLEKNGVPSGYPSRIRVQWDNPHELPGEEQIAEFIFQRWNYEKAIVHGKHLPYNEIKLPDIEKWEEFLDRWLKINVGNPVYINQIIQRPTRDSDGYLLCLTRENILVRVEVESLTMQPLKHQDYLPGIWKGRNAEICYIDWQPHTIKINYNQLPNEVIENGKGQGILTRVPRDKKGNLGVCGVLWKVDTQAIPSELQIDDLTQLGISLASHIFVEREGYRWDAHWKLTINSPRIRVRALWKETLFESPKQKLYYLGIPNGKSKAIAEVKPGEFVFLPRKPVEQVDIADGVEFEQGVSAGCRVINTSTGRPFQEGKFRYRRAVLSLDDDKLLIGNCRANNSSGIFSLDRIQLNLSEKGDNLFELRREFILSPVRDNQALDGEQGTDNPNEIWEKRLKEYENAPRKLEATFNPRDAKMRVRLDLRGGDDDIKVPENLQRTKWTEWVPLAPDEGAFVVEGLYSRQAKVVLFYEESQNQIMASLRRVPFLTCDEFQANLGAGWDDPVELKPRRLYYVGPVDLKQDQYHQIESAETHHRFEMGYGEILLIPESQLRFDGGEFKRAQLLLFHGDLITRLTFLRDETKETGCIININNIQLSEGQSLFYQRTKYQIVHLLHLKVSKDRVEIESVEGFDETHPEVGKTRSFNRVPAKLKEESIERLLNRRQESADNSEEKYVIFGRLDDKEYRKSRGQKLIFEQVRFSFKELPGEASYLKDNERVFLESGDITPWGENDIALELLPPKGFPSNDIGADIPESRDGKKKKSIGLLRRDFSVREDILARFEKNEPERNYLQEKILLVSLKRYEDKISPSLRRVPPRKESALIGLLESEKLVLAPVADLTQDWVQIELKPGIFVNLQREQIEYRDQLTEGAIVRIERIRTKNNYKFCLTLAVFGDSRYLPSNGTRPAVTLPKNRLFKSQDWQEGKVKEDNYWQGSRSFTIGGLPNIQASPGSYNQSNSAWEEPQAEEFIELMQTPHPKLVCLGKVFLGKGSQEHFRIAPLTSDFPVGRLLRSVEDSLNVRYVPQGNAPKCCDLSWLELSFGDESVQEIIARVNRENWRYHDKSTQTWSAKKKKFEREELDNHTARTGPLFFQLRDEQLRLRYTKEEFLRFGFPVNELIYALKEKLDKCDTYPVAGISSKGGLWIELTPGRIVELPCELVVSGMTQESLAQLYWKGFAPGDRVELQVISSDPLKIELVALKNWIPGPRKAFGSQRCFLPVQKDSTKKGMLTLGGGEFTLTLPVPNPEPDWETVVLTPDNNLDEIGTLSSDKRQPLPGDVVLLGINNEGMSIVLGLDGLEPYPDRDDAAWINELLGIDLIDRGEERFFIKQKALRELLNVLGGALPVTVKEVDEEKAILFFSLRHQRQAANLPPGRLSMARVVGLLPDNRTVLLRCGGGLIKISIDQIVSGLPESLFQTAVDALKESQVLIGLRTEEDKKLNVGLKAESNRVIQVKALAVISSNAFEPEMGLICQSVDSMALYWLPSQEAAWTKLSKEQLKQIFVSQEQHTFKVKPVGKPVYASVLEVQEVKNQFQNLNIGEELTVKVIKSAGGRKNGKRRYLVESFTAKVILECETYDNEKLDDEAEILVEVVRRISGEQKLLTVVPAGKKRQSLDLPQWMTNALPNPGEYTEAWNKHCLWQAQVKKRKPTLDDAENLDFLLCYAYYDAYDASEGDRDRFPRFQATVAKAWIKKNFSKPEISVAYALMAILLLYKNANSTQTEDELAQRLQLATTQVNEFVSDWKTLARDMTQNLGRRALRSMHVDILYNRWLKSKDYRERLDRLWNRLQQIDKHLRDRQEVDKIIGIIRQFRGAVELRNKDDTEAKEICPISDGLAAALGELSNISELDSAAELTKELINLYRTLPLTRSSLQVPLHEFHVGQLRNLLNRLLYYTPDFTLLEPLEGTCKSPIHVYQPIDLLYLLGNNITERDEEIHRIWQQLSTLCRISEYCEKLKPGIERLQDGFERLSKMLSQ